MAKLTTSERHALPKGDFALPGGRYPIPDESHGRNALARVSQFGSSEEKSEVRAKVRRKFPGIEVAHSSPKADCAHHDCKEPKAHHR